MENKRKLGNMYERMAGEYLCGIGCEILEYNYYTSYGEIDIIAKDGVCIVFVEVKYRATAKNGHPFEAISPTKQKTMCKCALHYVRKHHLTDVPLRFDVIGILGENIQWIQNAFDFRR